jgi:hypothetical protein
LLLRSAAKRNAKSAEAAVAAVQEATVGKRSAPKKKKSPAAAKAAKAATKTATKAVAGPLAQKSKAKKAPAGLFEKLCTACKEGDIAAFEDSVQFLSSAILKQRDPENHVGGSSHLGRVSLTHCTLAGSNSAPLCRLPRPHQHR